MAKITASEVNKLRKHTGAGMMDCKKALVESDGDFDAAVEILRKKGQKVAAKRGENEAAEGIVISKSNGGSGVIIKVNCETDFVAKNDDFVKFVDQLASIALENGADSVEKLKELKFDDISVEEKLTEQIGKIGEKIEISKLGSINAETVVAYNHPGNQVGSLVGLNKEGDKVEEAGKDVAMQVAAMNPVALVKDEVPQDVIDKEIEIGKDTARQEGKPEEMLEKISMGKLNKFFKENTLLAQAFIKDNKTSVEKYLDGVESGLTVKEFLRYSLS
ncbi:translation elongation factor Ts [Salibacter halophilus]|jgi:elongation factor Ts|uniref:Elongation factor Ts n=1 Tax=Salibacter halophilus TaxID=1803916 RepID=A0A6N6M666_9FLAO|nr:translation elongation factor Ts [Salibacter halophilus]KAB1063428.1 elongation factor Ts [Salibacter halophilus]